VVGNAKPKDPREGSWSTSKEEEGYKTHLLRGLDLERELSGGRREDHREKGGG